MGFPTSTCTWGFYGWDSPFFNFFIDKLYTLIDVRKRAAFSLLFNDLGQGREMINHDTLGNWRKKWDISLRSNYHFFLLFLEWYCKREMIKPWDFAREGPWSVTTVSFLLFFLMFLGIMVAHASKCDLFFPAMMGISCLERSCEGDGEESSKRTVNLWKALQFGTQSKSHEAFRIPCRKLAPMRPCLSI